MRKSSEDTQVWQALDFKVRDSKYTEARTNIVHLENYEQCV